MTTKQKNDAFVKDLEDRGYSDLVPTLLDRLKAARRKGLENLTEDEKEKYGDYL